MEGEVQVQGQEAPAPAPAAPQSEEAQIAAAMAAAEAAGEAEIRDTEAEVEPAPQATPAPASEPQPEPEKPAKSAEESRLEQSYAELTYRDRKIKADAQRLAEERRAHQKDLEELTQLRQAKALLKKDAISGLKEFDLDILEVLSSPGLNDSPEAKRDAEIKRLAETVERLERERLEERKASEERARKSSEERVYRGMLDEIHGVVGGDPEVYEAIQDRGEEGLQAVYRALEATYQRMVERGLEPGKPNADDIAKHAKFVEDALRKQEVEELKQKAERKRFQGRLSIFGEPTTTEVAAATAPNAASQKSNSTTLTNDLQGAPVAKVEPRVLTEEERYQLALEVPFPGKSG